MMTLLARFLPFLTQLIPGRGTIYLLLIACAVSAASGGWVVYKFWKAAEVEAVNEARVAERAGRDIGDAHQRAALERGRIRDQENRRALDTLQRRLAAVKPCPVPVPVEWLPDGERVPRAAADPAAARPADASVDPPPGPVADSRDVVLTCERNRRESYQPEADDRAALRAWYENVRNEYNRRR